MRLATLLCFLSLVVFSASAQVELVSDIYPGSEDSSPSNFHVFQGDLYFYAKSPEYGGEIWRYDGTTVSLGIDLIPGPESGRPYALRTVGDQLFFLATDGASGWEPWLFDGEEAFLVQDIWPGAQGQPGPHSFAVLDDRLFFRANDIEHGFEQWVVEADTARLVADINPGPGDAWIDDNTVYNGEIFFEACVIEWDCELWATDGNTTRLVADLFPGEHGSFPHDFVEYSGQSSQSGALYFVANGVWMTDGTNVELAPGFEQNNSYSLAGAHEYNGYLYLSAYTDATGTELWRYDGEQVEMVADLEPGVGGSYPYAIGVFSNALYVTTCDWDVYPELSTCRLWEVRGDEIQEKGSWIDGGPYAITEWKGKLYFTVFDDELGSELWVLEENGADLVIDLYPGPESGAQYLTVYNGQLLFRGNDGVHGRELWRVQAQPTATEEPVDSRRSSLVVYPNPAGNAATVELDLRTSQRVSIDVVDVLGRVVAVLHDGLLAAGAHSFSLSMERLPAGVYVVRAETASGQSMSRAVTILH